MSGASAAKKRAGLKSSRKGSQKPRTRAKRAAQASGASKATSMPLASSPRVPAPVLPHQGANGRIISSINFGRPTKCEPEIIEQLCECIREGMSYAASCDAILLPISTFKEWSRRARVEMQRIEDERRRIAETAPEGILSHEEIEVEPIESERIFLYFLASVKKAEAEFRRNNLKNIKKAGDDPLKWQASAWLLERRLREEFGRTSAEASPPPPPPGQQGNRPLDTGARIFEFYVNAPSVEMPDFNEPEDLNPMREKDEED